MNVIALKNKYKSKMVELFPFIDDEGHISGTFWLINDDKK